MKTLVFLIASVMCGLSVSAQKDSVIVRDGWRKDTLRRQDARIDTLHRDDEMIIWDNTVRDPQQHLTRQQMRQLGTPVPFYFPNVNMRPPRFRAHWNGFYFGFVNFDQADYSKYADPDDSFMDLDWANSFSVQLNFTKYSFGFTPRFGVMVGIGSEYMRLTFDDRVTVRREKGEMLQPVPLAELGIDNVRRSTFKALYLTVPFLIEKQFNVGNGSWKKMYVSTGIIGGIRLHSKTKVVYNNDKGRKRKLKDSGSYAMVPVKADVTLRVGYRGVGVFANYALTNMFDKDRAPALRPYTVGFGFSF